MKNISKRTLVGLCAAVALVSCGGGKDSKSTGTVLGGATNPNASNQPATISRLQTNASIYALPATTTKPTNMSEQGSGAQYLNQNYTANYLIRQIGPFVKRAVAEKGTATKKTENSYSFLCSNNGIADVTFDSTYMKVDLRDCKLEETLEFYSDDVDKDGVFEPREVTANGVFSIEIDVDESSRTKSTVVYLDLNGIRVNFENNEFGFDVQMYGKAGMKYSVVESSERREINEWGQARTSVTMNVAEENVEYSTKQFKDGSGGADTITESSVRIIGTMNDKSYSQNNSTSSRAVDMYLSRLQTSLISTRVKTPTSDKFFPEKFTFQYNGRIMNKLPNNSYSEIKVETREAFTYFNYLGSRLPTDFRSYSVQGRPIFLANSGFMVIEGDPASDFLQFFFNSNNAKFVEICTVDDSNAPPTAANSVDNDVSEAGCAAKFQEAGDWYKFRKARFNDVSCMKAIQRSSSLEVLSIEGSIFGQGNPLLGNGPSSRAMIKGFANGALGAPGSCS